MNKFFSNKRGFGGVVSTLIMFIAVVGVTTGLVVSFQNYIADTQEGFQVQNEFTSNKLKTSLTLVNIFYNSSSSTLYGYVKNTGETILSADDFIVFLDDTYVSIFNVSEAGNFSSPITQFGIQETGVVIISTTLSAGTHDLKVLSEYGVGDEDSFNN